MGGSDSPVVDLSQHPFQRILLVKPSSLGDVLHALPVLHGLRARYPQAMIEWLIGSSLAPLLEELDGVNGLVLFDRKRLARLGRSFRATGEFTRLIRRLRERRYDLVIDLQGLFRTGFLTRATGAPVRLGFANAREGARLFYTHLIPIDNPDQHAVDRNYLVSKWFGFEDVPIRFGLVSGAPARTAAAALLRAGGVGPETEVVGVVPGARWETKVWLPERFVETIDELQADGDVRCVLLGGSGEVELCDRIAEKCQTRPINLAGQTDLPMLAALVDRANVVLCHDSGVMHLAVALDRPLVCLVGPTNYRRTGPYRRSNDVVRLDLECSPCYLRKLAHCSHGHRCMTDLDSSRVVSAVRRSLDHSVTEA